MKDEKRDWLDWAVELQSLAQSALYYCKDKYDIERFERIREISAEMISRQADMPFEKAKDLFCCEVGYQTPKMDCRAAIIEGDKILLVQENDGRWSMPGGWVDVDLSVKENTIVIETGADRVRIEFTKWAVSTKNSSAAAAEQK